VLDVIDWTPFFIAWELSGKFPKILEDEVVGEAARELFANAQDMLKDLIDNKRISANAVIGFWPANRIGDDDIEVYDEKGNVQAVLHHLRQQAEKADGIPNQSLADYIAPKGTKTDYIGGFAVTAGINVEEIAKAFKAENDDFSAIMVQALADRMAEGLAEYMHRKVRTLYWGYRKDEDLSNEDLIQEKYQGIRPAPGYPACPDHTEKATLFRLLNATEETGIKLTENYAMYPTAAVSGWYFAHPESKYFAIGKVTKDQIEDYAARKNLSVENAERWLRSYLAYGA